MTAKDPDSAKRASLLSRALKAVRRVRSASSRDLAAALGLSLRGYQHFEAGGGQINVDHVLKFGAALDADAIGVLTAVQIGQPEFAAWVAQNKAMIAWMITLQEFVEETGEDIARLETTTLVSSYRAMFKDLAVQAKAAREDNAAWIARNAGRVGLPGPPAADRAEGSGTDEDEGS